MLQRAMYKSNTTRIKSINENSQSHKEKEMKRQNFNALQKIRVEYKTTNIYIQQCMYSLFHDDIFTYNERVHSHTKYVQENVSLSSRESARSTFYFSAIYNV